MTMCIRNQASLALFTVFICCQQASFSDARSDEIELRKNERIALVGNSLAERMNLYGHFETQLHSMLPDRELLFRNFGFPADAVENQQRPNDYTRIDDPLRVFSPETFICFFGYNESFAGPDGIDLFKANYLNYIEQLQKEFGGEESKPRIILVSPIGFEPTGEEFQPEGVQENSNLAIYTQAVREVAEVRGLMFVNLFDESLRLFGEQPGAQYTINGCHINEQGDRLVSDLLMGALFSGSAESEKSRSVDQPLRDAVNDKSWVHMNDYRMLNGWYVYGERRTYDTETFPLEYKKIRAMVAVRDRRVWDIAQGKPVPAEADDSETGELLVPPTGLGRHYPRAEPLELKYLTPEESIATMKVPDGMEVQLFASEREFPELANPCQIDFDNRGRLWVSCMPNYPQWRPGDPRPDDRLLILEDTDDDGMADKCSAFYDKLICPTGFEFFDGGVLVVDEPRILFLKDTDGDDRADVVEQIIDGIATDDTHHTMGAWEWSHGGQLHLLEGVSMSTTLETPWGPFRNRNSPGCYVFDPRSLKWRRFITPGYGNPWCFVFDKWGMGIVGDGTNGQQHWSSPLSGADPGQRETTRPVFDNQGMRPAVGSDFLISRHLPDEMQDQFIYACVINMNGIPRFTVRDEENEAGFTGERIANLLDSTDKTFRPVDPKIGPDGAIWFGDWCNALIGHMQYSQRDPNRDRLHGRVYRLVNTQKPLIEPAIQQDRSIGELLNQLMAYELRTRYRARRELRDRDPDQVMAELKEWTDGLSNSDDEQYTRHLCEALWIQESFHRVDASLLQAILASNSFQARAAAIHVIGNEHEYIDNAFEMLKSALDDGNFRVRLEAVRGLSLIGDVPSAQAVLTVVNKQVDYWIDYTLKHALMAMQPRWQASHSKGEFAGALNEPERQWFENYLASLGPANSAMLHLQKLTAADSDETMRHDAILALAGIGGDAHHGRIVFQQVCTACHRIEDRGINFGPAIDSIHKRVEKDRIRASIIYSIVEPNREIADEYQTKKVLTTDGLLYSGFVEQEDENGIVMRLAGDRILKIPTDGIEDSSIEKVSSMPEGLGYSLGPGEFLDVVEYIANLNGAGIPESAEQTKASGR